MKKFSELEPTTRASFIGHMDRQWQQLYELELDFLEPYITYAITPRSLMYFDPTLAAQESFYLSEAKYTPVEEPLGKACLADVQCACWMEAHNERSRAA